MGNIMDNLKILNSRETKNIHSKLKERFGFEKSLDSAFLINNKNRVYIINKDFSKIDTKKLRINSVGLYFGEINKSEVRLSIEGAQLIGKDCSKNILELDEKETKEWLKGFDLYKDIKDKGFIILKHKEDFLGCGKAVEAKILNYVPKNRRLKVSD
jgi:NOL1/NOP2/fmu family ribosome biogenesis protein